MSVSLPLETQWGEKERVRKKKKETKRERERQTEKERQKGKKEKGRKRNKGWWYSWKKNFCAHIKGLGTSAGNRNDPEIVGTGAPIMGAGKN